MPKLDFASCTLDGTGSMVIVNDGKDLLLQNGNCTRVRYLENCVVNAQGDFIETSYRQAGTELNSGRSGTAFLVKALSIEKQIGG
jgi:hypothetical protein